MVKLLENTFRAVNISLVNELALLCDRVGISIWEVVDAAATKPLGFMPFYPGPGLGGHCIAVDPFYLSWKVRELGLEARFIELAGQVNSAMPHYVLEKITDALESCGKPLKDANVLILGVAYKRDIDDVRESPALDVISLLLAEGARVTYHDPFVPRIGGEHWAGDPVMQSVPYDREAIAAADCVVVLTDHTSLDYDEVASAAQVVVDTRNAISRPAGNVIKLGEPSPRRSVSPSPG